MKSQILLFTIIIVIDSLILLWLWKSIFQDLFSPSPEIVYSHNISWVLKPLQATSFAVRSKENTSERPKLLKNTKNFFFKIV